MSQWRDCAVTLIDVPDIKRLAEQPISQASELMRRMHSMVSEEMKAALRAHAHEYTWNDSVLLLAFLDEASGSAEAVLREADGLKRKLDSLVRSHGLPDSYAIAMKGQTFPDVGGVAGAYGDRAVVIRASSYAMANCFLIEERIGKVLKKPWYVDGRLAAAIKTQQRPQKRKVKLLRGNKVRDVYVYSGYLWGGPKIAPQRTVGSRSSPSAAGRGR